MVEKWQIKIKRRHYCLGTTRLHSCMQRSTGKLRVAPGCRNCRGKKLTSGSTLKHAIIKLIWLIVFLYGMSLWFESILFKSKQNKKPKPKTHNKGESHPYLREWQLRWITMTVIFRRYNFGEWRIEKLNFESSLKATERHRPKKQPSLNYNYNYCGESLSIQ